MANEMCLTVNVSVGISVAVPGSSLPVPVQSDGEVRTGLRYFPFLARGRGSATCLGLGEDGGSWVAVRTFLRRAPDKAQNLPTPKISFLLGFCSFNFRNTEKSK